MIANIGMIDRIIRGVVGLALLSLMFLLSGPLHWVGLVGIIPIVTGLFSFCPAYQMIGINTCGGEGYIKVEREDGCGKGGCGCGH